MFRICTLHLPAQCARHTYAAFSLFLALFLSVFLYPALVRCHEDLLLLLQTQRDSLLCRHDLPV